MGITSMDPGTHVGPSLATALDTTDCLPDPLHLAWLRGSLQLRLQLTASLRGTPLGIFQGLHQIGNLLACTLTPLLSS